MRVQTVFHLTIDYPFKVGNIILEYSQRPDVEEIKRKVQHWNEEKGVKSEHAFVTTKYRIIYEDNESGAGSSPE